MVTMIEAAKEYVEAKKRLEDEFKSFKIRQ